MLHINHAWEPHVNQDSHTECCMLTVHGRHMLIKICSYVTQFLTKNVIKFHLKIPTLESQHCLQSNLSQIHSYHGLKRPKKKRNNNLWEVYFSSVAVVSKQLLGCSGHFLFILCHCNPTAHSVMCTVYMQLQRTA